MAKFTKSDLKKMMKECLEEILEEKGFSIVSEVRSAPPTTPSLASHLDMTTENTVPAPVQPARTRENHVLKENVNILANSIGQTNPEQQDLFASIFEDTAMNTLQEQREHGQGGIPTKEASPEVIAEEVKQLEGLSVDGDIGRWAQVALGDQSKK